MDRKSKDFKALQAAWDRKLSRTGFTDIETRQGRLKRYDGQFFQTQLGKKGLQFFEAKEEYFRRAGQFLHEHQFAYAFEKKVWELHTDGMSVREIEKQLNRKGKVTNRRTVHETLQALTKILLEKDGL